MTTAQPSLFDDDDGDNRAIDRGADRRPPAAAAAAKSLSTMAAAPPDPEMANDAAQLQQRFADRCYLGTSSWHFPGWAGLVYGREYAEATLSKRGLLAYSQHPLLRSVSLDRAFYRPLEAATYAQLAAQVTPGFRFVVKAPALITDATLREPGSGRPTEKNPSFLDADLAIEQAVKPATAGLGATFGVLVFQLSPLPWEMLVNIDAFYDRLDRFWSLVLPALPTGTLAALEVRDPALVSPRMATHLMAHGVRYCLGLHDRLPPVDQQIDLLRATWPGDLVCRWNLQRGLRYNQARDLWAPFDRLQAPDPKTREALARVIASTLAAGFRAFVTINNKAEGSAPLSVAALARQILATTP